MNIIRASNGLDLDQDQCSVGPDLDPNGYQQMTNVVVSRERV